uniref:Uncharacterized protein n=1 Tax=Oryza sativa subsp. japonica TaxID=39947 RepID=Q6ETL4_ORYSJ|nr:hypothetical protein [Oryza sativa Japonica Group]
MKERRQRLSPQRCGGGGGGGGGGEDDELETTARYGGVGAGIYPRQWRRRREAERDRSAKNIKCWWRRRGRASGNNRD